MSILRCLMVVLVSISLFGCVSTREIRSQIALSLDQKPRANVWIVLEKEKSTAE